MNLTELRLFLNLNEELETLEKEIEKVNEEVNNLNQEKEILENLKATMYDPLMTLKKQVTFYHKLFKTKKFKSLTETNEKYDSINNQVKNADAKIRQLLLLENEKEKILEKKRNALTLNYQVEMTFYSKSKNMRINPLGFLEITANNENITSNYINQDITKNFSLEDDIMLVHATSYFPENASIKTLHDKKVPVFTNGADTKAVRNTIHFSLNGKVSSNNGGNWDGKPIIILEPIKYHIEQLDCIKTNDSYTYGSVKLSNESIMLISKSEFEKIYSEHKEEIDKKKEQIIIFEGDSKVAVDNILILLGYKPQHNGNYDWQDLKNSKFFENYITKNFPNKLTGPHYYNKHRILEEHFSIRNLALDTFRNQTGDYSNDTIISLEELYILYINYYSFGPTVDIFNDNNEEYIKSFIKNYGISCHDNEIHLLSYKEALVNYEKEVSDNQIQKVKLLLKKYEISKQLENKHESKEK